MSLPQGVPKSTFKDRLCKRFGIVLTDEEVDLLFRGCGARAA